MKRFLVAANQRWQDSAVGRVAGAYVDDLYYWFWRRRLPYRWHGRRLAIRLTRHPRIRPWNWDKPHRCPTCHAIHYSDDPMMWQRVYRCCRCSTLFARWPRVALWMWAFGRQPVHQCVDHDQEEAKS